MYIYIYIYINMYVCKSIFHKSIKLLLKTYNLFILIIHKWHISANGVILHFHSLMYLYCIRYYVPQNAGNNADFYKQNF